MWIVLLRICAVISKCLNDIGLRLFTTKSDVQNLEYIPLVH